MEWRSTTYTVVLCGKAKKRKLNSLGNSGLEINMSKTVEMRTNKNNFTPLTINEQMLHRRINVYYLGS